MLTEKLNIKLATSDMFLNYFQKKYIIYVKTHTRIVAFISIKLNYSCTDLKYY